MTRRSPVPSTGGRVWCGDDGSVWSVKPGRAPIKLNQHAKASRTERARKRGLYLSIDVNIDGVRKRMMVHRLVAEAFCEGFHPLLEVHHINGNSADNRAANLACMTRAEHERAHGICVQDADVVNCRMLFEEEARAYDERNVSGKPLTGYFARLMARADKLVLRASAAPAAATNGNTRKEAPMPEQPKEGQEVEAIEFGELTLELRRRLDEAGFEWYDESEDFTDEANFHLHVERTKVLVGYKTIASCIYGYLEVNGVAEPFTYGYPKLIECAYRYGRLALEPEALTIDEIIEGASEIRKRVR